MWFLDPVELRCVLCREPALTSIDESEDCEECRWIDLRPAVERAGWLIDKYLSRVLIEGDEMNEVKMARCILERGLRND